jgi:hypothetical protein
MRSVCAMILLGLLASAVAAQEAPVNVQTLAASTDAREALRQQVLAARVAPALTVRQLLDRTGGWTELEKALGTAQQIGGTRWLDNETVQVRLLIEGAALADALNLAVAKNPSKSPLPADTIRRNLAQWRDRTFSATGTGTASTDVTRLQPPPDDAAWAAVNDADRRRALAMARENAIARVIDSLRPIEMGDKTLGDALSNPEVGQALSNWLYARPIASVQFRDDLSIRLVLAVSSEELWHSLEPALSRQTQVPPPATKQGWDWLEKQVEARMSPAVGTGVVQPANRAARLAAELPSEPPAWSLKPLTAEGSSAANGSKLQTARAAEAVALQGLRHQIELLPLTASTTIGQASRQDPGIEKAVLRAVNRAHPYQVDYKADGAATVYVTTSAADLWALLCAAR